MKKLLFILIILAVLILGGIQYVTGRFHEDISKDDLPETVYATEDSIGDGMDDTALDLFDAQSEEDRYDFVETFINFVIYDSIKENLNEDYDPLGDCEEEACSTIVTSNIANIEYAYAHLNEDDQLILTVNAKRGSYPSFETAVHLTFDIEIDILETSMVLTLDKTHLADDEISESMLDRIIGYLDKETIEDSVTTGTLDLDAKTYTYDFTE
ncbi:MAG: hypothetical protein ACLFUQ_04575 [Candidatus Izemoplasmataceae bacterium]